MLVGFVTVDGRSVGTVEANLMQDAPRLEAYEPSDALEQEDSRPRLGHARGFYPGQGSNQHGTRLGHAKGFYPKGHGGQVSGGDYGRTGGRTEANFFGSARAHAAGIDSAPGENLTTVQTKAGPITVNKAAAEDMTGAVNELVEAGAPIGHPQSYVNRNIAGSSRKSQHAYGGAMDLFNQSKRNEISQAGMNWIKNNPDKWRDIKQKHNLVGGEEFGDVGHVEWGGPGYGARHYGKGSAPSSTSPGGKQVKGSWFDDATTASGLSAATTPGIALPSREGLGKMHEITGPNGQKVILPQIDVGPAAWTGRGIDISKGALDKFGYTPKNFPTNAPFSHKPVEETNVPGNLFVSRPKHDDWTKHRADAPLTKRRDEYFGTDSRTVRRGNVPEWVKDNPDFRHSENIEDRRHNDTSLKGRTLGHIFRNKALGTADTAFRDVIEDKTKNELSKKLGINNLPPGDDY